MRRHASQTYFLLLHPQLFEERDAELDRNDRQIAEMTAAAAQRDASIAELRAELGTAQGRLEGERSKLADLETFYSEQLRALKEAIEAARRSRDDEAKRWRSEMEAQRAELESRARSREAEWEAQRREMTESADAAIAAMQRESRRREDDALQAVRRAQACLSPYTRIPTPTPAGSRVGRPAVACESAGGRDAAAAGGIIGLAGVDARRAVRRRAARGGARKIPRPAAIGL